MASFKQVDDTLFGGLLPGGKPLREDPNEEARKACIARGGTWNEATQTCKLPETKTKTQVPKTVTPSAPPGTVTTDAETGEVKGFINSEGNFVKASRSDVQGIVSKQQAKTAIPEGATTTEQFSQQQRLNQQISKIGQIGQLDPAIEADINLSQAFTSGLANVIPSAAGAAAGGALVGGVAGAGVGSTVTAPTGAIIGGVGGAVTGFVRGTLSNIKEQQRGELQAADVELTKATTNMRQLAMLASQDPANADIYISQYNQQLTRVYQARRQTKAEVSGDLNAFMEDGREQLADFDTFLQVGGTADIYGQKLTIALSSGVPLSINGEGLLE